MKKIFATVLSVIMLCLFCSCALQASSKEFTKLEMTITLTDEFNEKEIISQTAYYESREAVVTALKEGFEVFEGTDMDPNDITTEKYAEICIEVNKLNDSSVTAGDKYSTFSYQKTINGEDYSYIAYCFRTDDAFWLIQFGSRTKDFDKFKEDFEKYANSVTFAPSEQK